MYVPVLAMAGPPGLELPSGAEIEIKVYDVQGAATILWLPAPPLRLTDIDGADFSLDAYRGQVLLVNFWASWCRPCVAEIPSLHRLDATLKHTDFKIVTVNVGEDLARVNRFLRQVPVELPVLMDYDASISKDWMIYVYPSSYLVDRQGNYLTHTLGHLNGIQRKLSG